MRPTAVLLIALAGCGPRFDDAPPGWVGDAGTITLTDATPDPCAVVDPLDPPIGCAGPSSSCGEEGITCRKDTPCGAPTRQGEPDVERLSHRIAHLRLFAPKELVPIAALLLEPRVRPRCVNQGGEQLSWLVRIDPTRKAVVTGSGRPSDDGETFAFTHETIDPAGYAKMCPGFVGPRAPIVVAPAAVTFAPVSETGFTTAWIMSLPIVVFDAIPWVLPLREVRLRVPEIDAVGSCIGSFLPNAWCTPNSGGWTPGGTMSAKLTLEDADLIPMRDLACRSLCAVLAPDASKIDGRVCKRDRAGKIPEWGDACAGDAGCHNAVAISATFASHGVTITP